MKSYLRFEAMTSPSSRSRRWTVRSVQTGALRGNVRWETRRQRYLFDASGYTVLDSNCLLELARFLELQTEKRRLR